MENITQLHKEAMDLAEEAMLAEKRGDIDIAHNLAFKALEKEKQAAELVKENISLEPTRSILFRSAASLAVDCGELREAERLIGAALAGNPPEEIAEELRDLLEDVNFKRHLSIKGVSLQPDEFQMSMNGKAVGHGIASTEDFIVRVTNAEKLLFRTAERKLGREFREGGRPTKAVTEPLSLYMTAPKAASFAVTFRLGQSDQMKLPSITFAHEIVEEFLTCLEMLNNEDLDNLHNRIADEDYYINFIKLAEQIAPDGEDITMVGFTSHDGRQIPFRTPKKRLPSAIPSVADEQELLTVRGLLLVADAHKEKEGLITVIDDAGGKHKIKVPRGMMSDIVKPMFEERVIVKGKRSKGQIQLQDIFLEDTPK